MVGANCPLVLCGTSVQLSSHEAGRAGLREAVPVRCIHEHAFLLFLKGETCSYRDHFTRPIFP